MMVEDTPFRAALQRSVALASLACLVAASAVGVWLAIVLLWPDAGRLMGPLTYGRWMPVHLDVQLFGWCSLPVVGVLMLRMLPPADSWHLAARLALAAWLGALAAGSLDWLGGHTSGKLFLDWSGADNIAFAAAQMFLWAVLAAGWWARRRIDRGRLSRRATDAGLLLLLAAVPLALYFSAQPSVYPPVNPDSGGATGHSLLASSLGVVGIALALPALLGRPARRRLVQESITAVLILIANWAVYLYIGHGNASHHDAEQIAGLGTLLVWPPLLVWWFRLFTWESTQRRWLIMTALWCALLAIDGWVLFLPGLLDRLKFTNAFVAHSHLAMAGLLTALNMLVLVSLAPASALARALDARLPWLLWNAGCAVMIAVLTWVGFHEAADPLAAYNGAPAVTFGYAVRLLTGAAMLGATLMWLRSAARRMPELPSETNSPRT
jgi:cytochrome c oxidase cbb3-type subunit 1